MRMLSKGEREQEWVKDLRVEIKQEIKKHEGGKISHKLKKRKLQPYLKTSNFIIYVNVVFLIVDHLFMQKATCFFL